jgi:hypothetical protein
MRLIAELGRFHQDTAVSMGGIVVVFGLIAYWIVKD